MTPHEVTLSQLLAALPEMRSHHAPTSTVYGFANHVSQLAVAELFGPQGKQTAQLGEFGSIAFPYTRMGAIDSTHLFGLDELIIFSFYWQNRARYRKVADMGANIGLHSIMLARAGFDVVSFEPDPTHYELLTRNVNANIAQRAPNLVNKAISVEEGELEFTRVLGNTTGSHLSGAKANPYGELDKFIVKVEAFLPVMRSVDFFKMDIEGHESVVLLATSRDDWANTDAMVEISSPDSAAKVFAHLHGLGVNMFAQKSGWQAVNTLAEMPENYKQGSLFITAKPHMPW
jgi:FkbM family methyltransferase